MGGLCYVYYELILYVTYLENISMFTHLGIVFTCDDSFVLGWSLYNQPVGILTSSCCTEWSL